MLLYRYWMHGIYLPLPCLALPCLPPDPQGSGLYGFREIFLPSRVFNLYLSAFLDATPPAAGTNFVVRKGKGKEIFFDTVLYIITLQSPTFKSSRVEALHPPISSLC
jgi:hypothetical protein